MCSFFAVTVADLSVSLIFINFRNSVATFQILTNGTILRDHVLTGALMLRTVLNTIANVNE